MCTLKIIIKVYETTWQCNVASRHHSLAELLNTQVIRISIKIRLPGWEEGLCRQLCKLILSQLLASLAFTRKIRGRISDRDFQTHSRRRDLSALFLHTYTTVGPRLVVHHILALQATLIGYSTYWTHVCGRIVKCVLRTLYIFRCSANASLSS